MKSISFDDGFRSYAINGDESRVIRINVTDLNTKKRFDEALEVIDRKIDEIKAMGDDEKKLVEADRVIRGQLDHVFGEGTCETAFGKTNVLSAVSGGRLIIEGFLDALMPVIMADMKSAAAAAKVKLEEKTQKYIEPVVLAKPPVVGMMPQTVDVDSMTKEEKQALLARLLA